MVGQIAELKDDPDTRASYGIRKGLSIREEICYTNLIQVFR